ncbi:MAG: hypothetical protein KA236_17060 [Verrucomicrobia bacterium]|jgi:hypothetical protein|nr:hypothetical protein [Verrucomicrobiota bacterium]
MFQKSGLDQLRVQKELLVLHSEVNRLLLAAQWQHLRAPQRWIGEATQTARRHPLWTAALGLGAGMVIVNTLGRRRAPVGWIGRVGQFASAILAVKKLFARAGRTA